MRSARLLTYFVMFAIVLASALGLSGCQDKKDKMVGAAVSGVDYLANYVSVQSFSLNGHHIGRAGKGSGYSCCFMIPVKWTPNYKIHVKWNVTNWRDCYGTMHETTVSIMKYSKPNDIYVSFLPGNKVKIVSSRYYPEDALKPGSPYPIKRQIPKKYPWKKWPLKKHCPQLYK